MALVWQPQEVAYSQLCQLLSEFQKPGANQGLILQQLDQAKHVPDFNNYLSFIFSKGDNLPLEVRQSAGLLLKNNLKQQYAGLSEDFRNYIKGDLLHVLSHPERVLRHTAGSITTTVVGARGLVGWPELVMWICGSLQSGSDAAALDGALDSLIKVVEDHPHEMDTQLVGASWGPAPAPVSGMLVPTLLTLLTSQSPDIRRRCLAILNEMFGQMPSGFHAALPQYSDAVLHLATDGSTGVRREVCIAFSQLINVHPELLQAQLPQLIEYMLASTQDADEEVALEATEFWLAFCESDMCERDSGLELLQPVLNRLVPILMKNMIFDEYDEEVQAAEEAELQQGQPDSEKDINPMHSKHSRHHHKDNAVELTANGEDGSDDDDDGDLRVWNLRKCSAAALDMLSNNLDDTNLLPLLLPIVEQRLSDPDWRIRESAILALGAVSEGCHTGLAPYLTSMVKMLLPVLQDPRPMVRIITCWSLGRFIQWVLIPPGSDAPQGPHGPVIAPENEALFEQIMFGLLSRVRDPNGRVQEAACSGLSELLEHAGHVTRGHILLSRMQPLIETLSQAVATCGRRNLRMLLDATATACEVIGGRVLHQHPAAVQVVVVPILNRWQAAGFVERGVVPIMEALTSITVSLGPAFEPYASAVFEQCVRLLALQLEASKSKGVAQSSQYDVDLHMAALDLLAGMSDGLRASMDPLVAAAGAQFPLMVLESCRDTSADVRQSAFALVGDLAKACPSHLLPRLDEFVAASLSWLEVPQLTEGNMPSANNAVWSLGELLVKAQPQQVCSHIVRLCEAAATPLLGGVRVSRSLQENAAITLGRAAWKCPNEVAPLLPHFLGPWCNALRNVWDDMEKEDAFRGLAAVVQLNPRQSVNAFPAIAGAITSWRYIADKSLKQQLVQMLKLLHDGVGAAGWQQMLAAIDTAVRNKLEEFCR